MKRLVCPFPFHLYRWLRLSSCGGRALTAAAAPLRCGLSFRGAQAPGTRAPVAAAQGRQALERRLRGCGAGLAAPRPARSSRTRARPVSRVGRQGPARCSTREGSGSRSCSARPRTWRERKRPEKLEGQHRRSLLDSRALLEYLRAAPLFHGLPRKYKLSVSTQVISKCY